MPDYVFRLSEIAFRDGTRFLLPALTVIVGPNNSGKSRCLKDIVRHLTQRGIDPLIVSTLKAELPASLEELRKNHDVERFQNRHGQWMRIDLDPELHASHNVSGYPWPDGYSNWKEKVRDFPAFAHQFGAQMIAHLGTDYRLALVKRCDLRGFPEEISKLLQLFYKRGSHADSTVSELARQEFGICTRLDYSELGCLQIRVGPELSGIPADPRDALPILSQYNVLDDQGDGVRSFIGILVALFSVNRPVFLVDEPEAFLHPPQATRIGRILAEQASSSRQIIVATHSVDVLRGMLSLRQDMLGPVGKPFHGPMNVFITPDERIHHASTRAHG